MSDEQQGDVIVVSGSRARSGLPLKWSAIAAAEIVAFVRAGKPFEHAAVYAGISPRTAYRWMQDGREDDDGELFDFYCRVTKARAEHEEELVERVANGVLSGERGDHDWKASAWLLEKMNPKRFGQRVMVNVTEVLDDVVSELRREFADEPGVMRRVFGAVSRALEKDG